MNLRSSECYKSSVDSATYTHCLKKKEFLDLMHTFPDAKQIFLERAKKRRVEMRRIKKQFEVFADVSKDPDEDKKKIEKETDKFVIRNYSSDSKSSQPPFLNEPDFYFVKSELKDFEQDVLE